MSNTEKNRAAIRGFTSETAANLAAAFELLELLIGDIESVSKLFAVIREHTVGSIVVLPIAIAGEEVADALTERLLDITARIGVITGDYIDLGAIA